MSNKPVYMLAIAPHPLDADLGLGGYVYHLTQAGKEIVYIIATNGDKGSSDPAMLPEKLAAMREKEQKAAAEILGVKEVIFLRHPDLGLEYTPEFRKEIVRLILNYKPEVVATCDPYEKYISNRDHRILGQLVMDCVWPAALSPNTYRDLLEEGLQLHRVQEVLLWQTAEPNDIHNIDDVFDMKLKALSCHKSQIGDPVEQGFIDYMTDLNSKSAEGQDFKFGEAFRRLQVLQRL